MIAKTETLPYINADASCVSLLRPPPSRNTFEWLCKYGRDHKGKLFNPVDYPWTKGICEAWDMRDVRRISMQFAARLGKTTLAMNLMICAMEYDPDTAMYGSATETIVKESVKDKYYKILEHSPATRELIPPPTRRIGTRVDLFTCKMYCAWSGSSTSLADKDPKYKHAGEIDKWTKNVSEEADPLDLFLERGIEIPDRKEILESTPAITHRSRIERALLTGWNCRWHVPCPKCGTFRQLILGKGPKSGTGGIIYDKSPSGKHDPTRAYKTARYQCPKCKKEWGDEHRRQQIRKGLWVPEGQYATKKGQLRGSMASPGPNASYQLSRIYAPTFTFADIARKHAECTGDNDQMRNFVNSWLGDTWLPNRTKATWEEVGDRLVTPLEREVVPSDCPFITMSVDVQIDHFVYTVWAWSSEAKGFLVDWGVAFTWSDVADVIRSGYKHADGGPDAYPVLTLIDCGEGARQDEIVDACEAMNHEDGPWVWPSKGSSGPLNYGATYRRNEFSDDLETPRQKKARKRRGLRGFYWITVNTPHWQSWLHRCLYVRKPGDPSSIAIPKQANRDEDLLTQLMNESPEEVTATSGHSSTKWVVVDTMIPVDLRDCARYARCAAEVVVNRAWERVGSRRRQFQRPPGHADQESPKNQTKQKKQSVTKPASVRGSDKSSFIRKSLQGFIRG